MESIELLKNKLFLFNNFLIERLGMPSEFFTETNQLIEKAYNEKNIKVLKSGEKEIYLQLKEMSPQNQLELKELFKQKLNIDISFQEELFDQSIGEILKRGKINSDEEYLILMDKMDNLKEIKTNNQIRKINKLLLEYQKKT